MHVVALNQTDIAPLEMPERFRLEVVYFMTPGDEPGAPALGEDEYWIQLEHAAQWLDDGVVEVISPLDAEAKAEIELSEDQERWLEWMVKHQIDHIRLVRKS